MSHPFIPDKVRDWLYPITLAIVALLGAYGVIDSPERAELWALLAAALLGNGTAAAYRPSKTVQPLRARQSVQDAQEGQ